MVMVLHLSTHNYQRFTTLAVVVALIQKNSLCAHFRKFSQTSVNISQQQISESVSIWTHSDKIIHTKRSRGECYWPFVTLANGLTRVGLVLGVISVDSVVGQMHEAVVQRLWWRRIST